MIFEHAFIDFDNTIYESHLLSDYIRDVFRLYGVTDEDYRASIERAVHGASGNYFDYSFESHVHILKNMGYDIAEADALPQLNKALDVNLVTPDAEEFLRFMRRITKKLILLTAGNSGFQTKKLHSTGLINYFDEIHIVHEEKEAYVREIHRDSHKNIFINDNLKQNCTIKELFPSMVVVTRRHPRKYDTDQLRNTGLPYFDTLTEIKSFIEHTCMTSVHHPFSHVGAVVLSAGKGTRLGCTDKPKVMLEIENKPMVAYTVDTLREIGLAKEQICLVVGFCKDVVMQYFGTSVSFAEQTELLGTAHAAYTGIQTLPKHISHVLVLGGDDSAFYTPQTVSEFIDQHIASGAVLSLLSAHLDDPAGYGRIVRHADGSIEIIEKEYLTEEQKRIQEISTGTFCFDRYWFEGMYPHMPPLRKLGEYGLPTAMAMAAEQGKKYQVVPLADSTEWFGVNTPAELDEARRRKAPTTQ